MLATSRKGLVRAFRVIADIDSGRDAWERATDGGAGGDCLDVVRSNVRSAQRIRPWIGNRTNARKRANAALAADWRDCRSSRFESRNGTSAGETVTDITA